MARQRKVKGLSIDKGQYVKAVGYCPSKSGKLQARRWYLCAVDDGPHVALAKSAKIKAAWAPLKATGATQWPQGADPLADAVGRTSAEPTALEAAPALQTPSDPNGLTVGSARDTYLASIKRRYEAGQVSHAYSVSETFNLERGVALLGADKPLVSIGTTELTAAVLALAARPLSKPTKGQ